jgi:hypothetical protein
MRHGNLSSPLIRPLYLSVLRNTIVAEMKTQTQSSVCLPDQKMESYGAPVCQNNKSGLVFQTTQCCDVAPKRYWPCVVIPLSACGVLFLQLRLGFSINTIHTCREKFVLYTLRSISVPHVIPSTLLLPTYGSH